MRSWIACLVAAGCLVVAACAKTPPPVTAPVAPRFPEFVAPVPQAGADAGRELDAWNALQAGNLGVAEREFTQLLKRSPANPALTAGLGYVALARKDYDHALDRFGQALTTTPGMAAALVGQALSYAETGRTREALGSFEAAHQADPSLDLGARIDALRFRAVEDAVARARAAASAGHLDQAAAAYTEALQASPDSPLLLRELATVERRAGDVAAARSHLERAAAADPGDRQTRLQLAELAESEGRLDAAIRHYEGAQAIERTPDVDTHIATLREKVELARLPDEYRAIPTAPLATRAGMAALIAVRLPGLLRAAPSRPVPLVTDVKVTWASPWIEAVLRAGVMEPFPNHTFQPDTGLRRGDLAIIVSRLLSLAAIVDPPRAGRWQKDRATLTDIPLSHPAYDAASRVVGARILDADRNGAFDPMRPVTGAEALDAVSRLERLAGPKAGPDRR
jgi:tetratricopeptide (TPR) repeat protein